MGNISGAGQTPMDGVHSRPNCEEDRHVVLLPFCKIFWNNLVLMCNICKSVVIKLL